MAVPDEDDAVGRAGGVAAYRHPLQKRVGIAFEDGLVIVRAGVSLLAVAQNVLGRTGRPHQEAPLDARRERGTSTAPQPRGGDLLDDIAGLHLEQRLVESLVAAPGDVLEDVVVGDVPRVPKGDPVLQAYAGQRAQVRHSGNGLIAEIAQRAVGDPVAPETGLQDRPDPVGRNIPEEESGTAGLGDVDQGLGEAYAEAAHLVDTRVYPQPRELGLYRLLDVERAGGVAAHGGADSDPRPLAGDELPPLAVGASLQLLERRHTTLQPRDGGTTDPLRPGAPARLSKDGLQVARSPAVAMRAACRPSSGEMSRGISTRLMQ